MKQTTTWNANAVALTVCSQRQSLSISSQVSVIMHLVISPQIAVTVVSAYIRRNRLKVEEAMFIMRAIALHNTHTCSINV